MTYKPKRHKSPIIQQLQQNRSVAEFEKTRKRMMLASKIADGIKAKGWNNCDLAQALDQHNSVISKWLSGTHNFTSDTLFDIEGVLNIDLFQWKGQQTKEIIHKYEFEISAQAADMISSSVSEESLQQYISLCGGMAITSFSTEVKQ